MSVDDHVNIHVNNLMYIKCKQLLAKVGALGERMACLYVSLEEMERKGHNFGTDVAKMCNTSETVHKLSSDQIKSLAATKTDYDSMLKSSSESIVTISSQTEFLFREYKELVATLSAILAGQHSKRDVLMHISN